MITAITPTCDRPFGIALCEKYMARQTVQPDEWIVADGGQIPAKLSMGQRHLWEKRDPGPGNLTANMRRAVEAAEGDLVVIVEDDDWYRSDHIEMAVQGLTEAPVYGCGWLQYYHVPDRRWARFRNRGSALCQTAFRASEKRRMLGAIDAAQSSGSYGIDGMFWTGRESLANGPQTVIGMKGLPGTKGLGVGHRSHPRVNWKHDPDLCELRRWIGNDATEYEKCSV